MMMTMTLMTPTMKIIMMMTMMMKIMIKMMKRHRMIFTVMIHW